MISKSNIPFETCSVYKAVLMQHLPSLLFVLLTWQMFHVSIEKQWVLDHTSGNVFYQVSSDYICAHWNYVSTLSHDSKQRNVPPLASSPITWGDSLTSNIWSKCFTEIPDKKLLSHLYESCRNTELPEKKVLLEVKYMTFGKYMNGSWILNMSITN